MWGVTKQEKVEGQWNATVRGIVVAVGGDDSGGSVDGETDGGGACGGNRTCDGGADGGGGVCVVGLGSLWW